MNFMSVSFTAQKHNILINVCVSGTNSGLLQQACDITGNVLEGASDPLPSAVLSVGFLPDQDQRSQLILPLLVHVDYWAACFCHQNRIEIGYVCSMCWSTFCNFSPICTTYKTAFKISLPPEGQEKDTEGAAWC